MPREEGGVNVETPILWDLQRGAREDLAISGDRDELGRLAPEAFQGLRCPYAGGLIDGNAQLGRSDRDGRLGESSAAPGLSVRLGHYKAYGVARVDQGLKRRHGEPWAAHVHDAQAPSQDVCRASATGPRGPLAAACLGGHGILGPATRSWGAEIVREAAPSYYPTIKDLPLAIRPRERLRAAGPQALSDEELIAIILRTGTQAFNVLDVARELLVQHEGLAGLNRATVSELAAARGVGPVKAIDLKAAFELGKRLLTRAPEERPQITGPEAAYALLRGDMGFLEQESVRVILLNTKNRVQKISSVSEGSLNSSIIRVGEVFRDAVREQSAAIVLAHNHPSGDTTPSAEDVAITRKVVEAGRLLDIDVLDHIIIGGPGAAAPGWISLRERRLGFDAS